MLLKIRIISIFVGLILQSISLSHQEKTLKEKVEQLTQQVLLQQFYAEQRVRSEGHSGLHLVRQRRSGDKNYFIETHNGYAAGSIHDHANNVRTVGLGQFSAVLNGVEFQTRHNDYRLNMPHRTSKEYDAVEPIPFPDVPPEVLKKPTVDEQVEEMREWFKAWQNEDSSTRDFTKYFKPVLCYLEGGWTNADRDIDEPFTSDRHFIDAKTWMGLHEKARYLSYSGSKSRLENLSFLPTKIISIKNGIPIYAQWNYRIVCHPLKKYLSVRKIKLVEDLSSRMMTGYNIFRHSQSRAARFDLNRTGTTHRPKEGRDFLDELMEQIPGKNNYKGSSEASKAYGDQNPYFYHRWFSTDKKDASGYTEHHRGFSDDTLFYARTTQSKIAGIQTDTCFDLIGTNPCFSEEEKWTFAIPLEIIYLTPLSKWNPYGLKYHGLHVKGTPATLEGRYGDCVPWKKKELNGTNAKRFYQTPDEFFSGKNNKGKADTSRPFSCVLDPKGVSHRMRASGTYILMPHIQNVGVARQRFPIFPVHGEGSSVWKELSALRDIIMDPKKYKDISAWGDFSYADSIFNRFTTIAPATTSSSNATMPSTDTPKVTVDKKPSAATTVVQYTKTVIVVAMCSLLFIILS